MKRVQYVRHFFPSMILPIEVSGVKQRFLTTKKQVK